MVQDVWLCRVTCVTTSGGVKSIDETLLQECGLSLRSGAYPVPVMPVRDMPDLERVLNASYAAFDALQQGFQTTFVLG